VRQLDGLAHANVVSGLGGEYEEGELLILAAIACVVAIVLMVVFILMNLLNMRYRMGLRTRQA